MPDGPALDPDAPGDLSIVVQGSLYDWNLVRTAQHCEHWRSLFPAAEIVLAVATTDILAGSTGERKVLDRPSLVPGRRHDGVLRAAVARLAESCDRIVLSQGALPLPPLKLDVKPNNVNLMIVAAKAGLAEVRGRYTLRIRSDMIFLDRSFVDFYLDHRDLPRRPGGAFRQRLMISPFFTLNPYALERLPFHFSDWFNLGLTEDVRALWSIGEMPLADASHHAVHPHPPAANALERKFRVRIAVEQHVTFGSLRSRYPDIRLDNLTDPRSKARSVEILLNDFLVCDHRVVPTVLEKYARTFADPNMEVLCITYPTWRRLLDLPPGTDFEAHFCGLARRARWEVLIREHPALRPVRFVRGAVRTIRRWAVSLLRGRPVRRPSRSLAGEPGLPPPAHSSRVSPNPVP